MHSRGKDFYVYVYYDHRLGNVPIYVGKGRGWRAFDHQKPSKGNHRLSRVLNKMRLSEIPIFFGLINCPDEEFAFLLEMELIARYGRLNVGTGSLMNFTDGGEGESGAVRSPEWRARHSRAITGRKWTAEAIAKRTATNKGVKRSAETKARMSVAQQALAKLRPNKRKGMKRSPEECAKISAGKLGKKRPPITDEARRNLSAAVTLWWAKRKAPCHT